MIKYPMLAVINESTVAKDLALSLIVNALDKQIWRDFIPAYGSDKGVNICFIPKGRPIPKDAWQCAILDNSDQAGALGYHDVTSGGLPLGKVFAEEDIKYGSSLSVTMSHEVLEMLADSQITKVFEMPGPNGTRIQYAYEDCDAVEDDSLAYDINGILLSDFVLPEWFSDPAAAKDGQYDFLGHCTKPLHLCAGGYIGTQIIGADGVPQGWTQITAKSAPIKPAHAIHQGSRRHRRRAGKRKLSTTLHHKFID